MLVLLIGGMAYNGEFHPNGGVIQRLKQLHDYDGDAMEAFIGLFCFGYLLNILLTLIRFKGRRLKAVGIQLLVEVALLLGLPFIFIGIGGILKWVAPVVGIVLLIAWMLRKRTRADALNELAQWASEHEDEMSEGEKRNILRRATSAALDFDKDDTDTSDIDDIMNGY